MNRPINHGAIQTDLKDLSMHDSFPSVSELFGSLQLLKVRFHCALSKPGHLPPFLGSSWRGVLGQSLRKTICPFPDHRSCSSCVVREQCPYFSLYEKASDLPGYKDGPRAYMLNPVGSPPGSGHPETGLDITLFGQAADFLPVVWQAMSAASETGLGVERIPFRIVRCEQAGPMGWQDLPNTPGGYHHAAAPSPLAEWLPPAPELPWRFHLATPVRLRRQGKYLSKMDWPFFLSSIAKRLEMLSVLYQGGAPIGPETWDELGCLFRQPAEISESLHWEDLARYSNRQKRKVPMGGLVGEATLSSASLQWWHWWQAACLTGVGKGAAMGLGLIRL